MRIVNRMLDLPSNTLVPSNRFNPNALALREVANRTWAQLRENDVLGRAAQLAYYFFLALFPFLVCVIASLSVFGFADRGRIILAELLARFVPTPAFQLINGTIDQIIQASGPVKMSFGIIASLWSASMGMGAIMSTLNAAYKVQESRSLFRQYLIAIELTGGIAILLIASLVVAVFGDDLVAAVFSGHTVFVLWKIAKWPLGLASLVLTFEITYYFAPDVDVDERDWRWITPGTVVGIFFLAIVSIGLRIYLHYSGSFGAAYGSLGAVIVLLLWFYLSGIALLSGGVLNAVMENSGARDLPATLQSGDSV
jgi:membrane protein